jgi:isoamylase
MAREPDRLAPGRPYPLGATWDGLGVNFAVFSTHADAIDLCLFDAGGRKEVARHRLPERTDDVWHGYLPEARPGLLYGYRAHGPYQPQRGHRFNPHKLLLDPYARQLVGSVRWNDALFGYRVGSPRGDLSFDRRDNAAAVPRSMVVVDDAFNWGDDHPPDIAWADSIIYEMHVRGFSVRRSDLPARKRGTFAALADPRIIDYLVKLGITAVELLPVHAFLQERHLVARGLRNFWGYSTVAFFAPEPLYLSDQSLSELRVAVRRLHAAGIEVILDVVYNHTGEGNEFGPTLSFRGLDNASYYRLVPGDERRMINDTGTGNTLNLSHPRVLQMVMDSLRHWVDMYHVDGFRFDLCVTLGREATGFDSGSGFFDAVRQDPVLSRVKLISEPWDVGPGGYQLGNHPPGFAEWNDQFRNCVRRFWRGDEGQRPELASRLSGSGEIFERNRRRPWASINHVTAHDGFTLHDVVSYAEKHNEGNGEDNRDGHDANDTSNWGQEGPSDDPAILAVRRRLVRAMLATLLVSHGTPMVLAGDECLRTQNGNNNAYCQDNEISWLDWDLAATEEAKALTRFTAGLTAMRKAHRSLRSDRFLHGLEELLPGVKDVTWFGADAVELEPEAWQDATTGALQVRRAARQPDGTIDVTLLVFNPDEEDRPFTIPSLTLGWRCVLRSHEGFCDDPVEDETFVAAGRSVSVLVASPDKSP